MIDGLSERLDLVVTQLWITRPVAKSEPAVVLEYRLDELPHPMTVGLSAPRSAVHREARRSCHTSASRRA